METEAAWTSKEIWPLIVATGVLSAFASFVLSLASDGIKGWWRKDSSSRYSAMQCATVLERYAVACWDVFIMSDGEYERYREMSSSSLPELSAFPNDVDWKSLDRNLADAVLSFATSSNMAQSLAHYARQWENNPFEFHDAARARGYAALRLASQIRQRYRMKSPTELNRIWKELSPKRE